MTVQTMTIQINYTGAYSLLTYFGQVVRGSLSGRDVSQSRAPSAAVLHDTRVRGARNATNLLAAWGNCREVRSELVSL